MTALDWLDRNLEAPGDSASFGVELGSLETFWFGGVNSSCRQRQEADVVVGDEQSILEVVIAALIGCLLGTMVFRRGNGAEDDPRSVGQTDQVGADDQIGLSERKWKRVTLIAAGVAVFWFAGPPPLPWPAVGHSALAVSTAGMFLWFQAWRKRRRGGTK